MEIKRKRVSAVIIQDKKILLVRGVDGFYKSFYFTPGGEIEGEETQVEALNRELLEELSLTPISFDKYFEYQAPLKNNDGTQQVTCYLVIIDIKKIKLASEIGEMRWFSVEDFENKELVVSESTRKFLVPKLVEDGLIGSVADLSGYFKNRAFTNKTAEEISSIEKKAIDDGYIK